jgi:hypothetical protein
MTTWTKDELNQIGTAEELRISPLLKDDSLRTPVTIWVVRVDDDLYVRCARGPRGAWYRAAVVRHQGRIKAGGVEKDVKFVDEHDSKINDEIDAVYHAKYKHLAQYVPPVVNAEARETTLKLVPR